MQLIRLFCFLVVSNFAAAGEDFNFSLYDVAFPDLVRIVLDDVAGASVVVSSDVVKDRDPVSFVLRKVSKAQAIEQVRHLAKGRGFELVKVHDVFHLRKISEIDQEMFVYVPKYRSVAYLNDLVSGIVNRSAVLTQRALPYQPNTQSLPGQGGLTQSVGDAGLNSMIDRADKDVLVIKAKPKEIEIIKTVLAQVDKPIPEMLVKAVVLEVQSGKVEGSALNLLARLVSDGVGSASVSWQGGSVEKNAIKLKVGGIDAIWTAINSDSRFKVISAPQIRVKSGATARFSVGSDTPVLAAVNYQGNGQSVQSVEYKPSGVILDLKPEIRGQLAELKVFQQLSSFAKTETGVNGSPTLLKRELSTSVVVGQNDVVLLGGLDEEKTSSESAGLMFFPRWMRSDSGSVSRSEIVLMLYVERVHSPGEVF